MQSPGFPEPALSGGNAPLKDVMPDWAAIGVVILGVTAFSVSQGLTYPLISLILASHGVSPMLSGLNASVFAVGLAVSTMLIGPITTVVRSDRLIVVGLAGAAMSLAAFAAFSPLWVWFLARFMLGFCTSIIFTMSEAWLNAACPDRLRGRVSGIYGAGMCAGFAAGPLAIPFVGTGDGFAFALVAVYVALVAFVSVLLTRYARTRPEPSPRGGLIRFARVAPVLVLMVVAFGFSDIAAISALPIYFVGSGYSQAFAAFSVTMIALPTALAQPFIGMLLDRFSRPLIAVSSGLVASACFLSIPFLGSEAAILVVLSLLGAASFSLYTCALTLLGDGYRGGLLVAGSAAYGLAYALGSAFGSAATGMVMSMVTPAAGPIGVGLILMFLSVFFGLGLRRGSATGPR